MRRADPGHVTVAMVFTSLLACAPPPSTEIGFRIVPAMACASVDVGAIGCVQLRLISARGGVECLEDVKEIPLPAHPRRIDPVRAQIAEMPPVFDVLAPRGYQLEALGFATDDCLPAPGKDPGYRFCGRSDPARFDVRPDRPIEIPVVCGERIDSCVEYNFSLRWCK